MKTIEKNGLENINYPWKNEKQEKLYFEKKLLLVDNVFHYEHSFYSLYYEIKNIYIFYFVFISFL